MNCYCSRYNCDRSNLMNKDIDESLNKRVKSSKRINNIKCSDSNVEKVKFCECDLWLKDIGSNSGSTEEQDVLKSRSKKPNKVNNSGFVDKIPLRGELIKSSPCVKYVVDNNKAIIQATNDPRVHRKKIIKKKSRISRDDIDYIPVKLVSVSEQNFSYSVNDKMNSARINALAKSPERKVNSWGRILKEQNVPGSKDQKKTTMAVPQTNKQKLLTLKNSQLGQNKERNVIYETTSGKLTAPKNIKSKLAENNVVKESYPLPLVKKKSSHHTPKIERPPSEYSDSSTSISGESIMLVDRSVQYSTTNFELDNVDSDDMHAPVNHINQAGDSGVAFLNPVRTLNFLLRELRGKLSEESDDANMTRIIRDMENTITRLTKMSPVSMKENWNTIISEEDLKCVLELLQANNAPVVNKISETERQTAELHEKLELTCNKLEEICKQMERTSCAKLKDEKQVLVNELKLKTIELEDALCRERKDENIISELKRKNQEQSKVIASLKENLAKSGTLNAILNEQLQDTEKKYQNVMTEIQFLILEKEKNLVLIKCKDQDIQEMRRKLEEIKSLVVQHLTSFQLEITNSGTAICGDKNFLSFHENTLLSDTLSTTVLPNHNRNVNENKTELPICSSPVETLSPSPDEDESWRKISDVPSSPSPIQQQELTKHPLNTNESQIQISALQHPPAKNVCIKESLRNLFDEMKRQTKLGKNLSIHNIFNSNDPTGLTNWSDLEFSDDEMRSIAGYGVSDTETNFSK